VKRRGHQPGGGASILRCTQIVDIADAARADQRSPAGALPYRCQCRQIGAVTGANAIERHHDYATRPAIIALPAARRIDRLAAALVE